ncbi:MAG: radical SAM family heme chaperone HemW [Anaerolineae bacterium]|nr:radical SAM family heme chaperone HemW [Anaerolineae bacterium]
MQLQSSPLSIYLHIPFCSTRCSYCAFNTYTDLAQLIPAYVDALGREISAAAAGAPQREVHTVYVGGGTPSLLTERQFERLLSRLHHAFYFSPTCEISLEANPDDLDAGYLRSLRELGFNRLSIGMQSANPDILRLFERQHDVSAVASAMEAARQAKFDNVNLDVIFGSPGESLANWADTVGTLLDFEPDHVSMYGLELKGGTELRLQVDAGALPQPDDDDFADMYEFASETMERAGYRQYEISNWRRPGKECRHNLQYWRNLPYLGLGAGAHGFAGGYRYSTITAPQRYVDALTEQPSTAMEFPLTPAVAKHTLVEEPADLYDTIMMGLRLTCEGINRSRFKQRFGQDFVAMFPDAVDRLVSLGLLEAHSDRLRLSPAGRLLSNGVIREFVAGITV